MIRFMDLPKGFVGFFPYTLPAGNTLVTHVDHFLEAVSTIDPSSILIFGDDAFSSRLLKMVTSSVTNSFSTRVIAAPSPTELCGYSSEALNRYLLQLLPALINTS
jgi:hypothetical protein